MDPMKLLNSLPVSSTIRPTSRLIMPVALATLCAALTFAQSPTYTLSTIAGAGGTGLTGDNGAATAALLNHPLAIARSASGNLYIADTFNNEIRVISPDGTIKLIAGNGTNGLTGDGAAANLAEVGPSYGIAVDAAGNLYFSDTATSAIRKITAAGIISTIGGNYRLGFGGDGEVATSVDAFLSEPTAVAVDAAGNVYFADTLNNRIRRIDAATSILTTFAGQGDANYTGDGKAATDAKLNGPQGLAIDSLGNIYIADTANHVIRKITSDGIITTVAGNGTNAFSGDGGLATQASLNYPKGIAVDGSGNIFIADTVNNRIRVVLENGKIYTIAGNGTFGDYDGNGVATQAQLLFPSAVALDGAGGLYFADTDNSKIRHLTLVAQTPAVKDGGVVSLSAFGAFRTIARGSWVEIYGSNLAQTTREWQTSDFQGDAAPTSLSGTSVTIGGQKAYVSYISPGQVNVQVPDGVPAGMQDVVVRTTMGASLAVSVEVDDTKPGLLAPSQFLAGGKQYAVAVLGDGAFSGPAGAFSGVNTRAPKPGETITFYGIGFGPVAPSASDGVIVSKQNATTQTMQVFFGDTPATVAYSGLVAGFLGLYQFNVVVPAIPANSTIPLTFKLNGAAGQQALVTAVGQ
jgi:uncharacterized protein (TIGR03437 family)